MSEDTPIKAVTVEKAAEMLGKSAHAVRQLVARGMIEGQTIGKRIRVDLSSVLTYHARKKGIPSYEDHFESIKNREFVSIKYTADKLWVAKDYVLSLIKQERLEGYITYSGDIMIPRDSVNEYLKKPVSAGTVETNNDASEL